MCIFLLVYVYVGQSFRACFTVRLMFLALVDWNVFNWCKCSWNRFLKSFGCRLCVSRLESSLEVWTELIFSFKLTKWRNFVVTHSSDHASPFLTITCSWFFFTAVLLRNNYVVKLHVSSSLPNSLIHVFKVNKETWLYVGHFFQPDQGLLLAISNGDFQEGS